MRPKISAPEGSPYGERTTLRCTTSMLPSFESPLPPMIASISVAPHRADLGKIAPVAFRVHAAAEDEAVGNLQADEIGRDGFLFIQDLLHQHCGMKIVGAELEQPVPDRAHGL